jgi:hypothetical protein
MMLTAAECDRLTRIAAYCAGTHPSWSRPGFGHGEKSDAAFDAIIADLADNGWPDEVSDLFQAGMSGINHALWNTRKDINHRHLWLPTSGGDELAEAITDRIGVWQLVWTLAPAEWAAVWAVAEVMQWQGDHAAAAALLGISVSALRGNLCRARERCRALWIAPGETPPVRKFTATHAGGKLSKAAMAVKTRRDQERKANQAS